METDCTATFLDNRCNELGTPCHINSWWVYPSFTIPSAYLRFVLATYVDTSWNNATYGTYDDKLIHESPEVWRSCVHPLRWHLYCGIVACLSEDCGCRV